MPSPIRNPKSLYESCLHSFANHFATCTLKGQIKALTDEVEEETCVSKCVVNPFEELPSELLLEITDYLIEKEWLTLENLEWLITPGTELLSFLIPIDCERTVAHFLQLASARCPKLRLLWMNVMEMCQLEHYIQFLPQFKNLQELNVSGNSETFNDSCLHILGIHCRDLRELNISGCDVTDNGVEWLCGGRPTTDLGHEELMHGQCKSLMILSISNSRVTMKGVQIALRNLPHLKFLQHEEVFQALVDMHENDEALPKYSLIKLKIKNPEFQSNPKGKCTLRLVASLCPSLICLIISNPEGITDSNLLGLSALEKLSEFKVSCFEQDDLITFDGGFVPLLKTRGSSLTKLKLECLSVTINLGIILMECCPNLEHLTVNYCGYSSLTESDNIGMASRPSKLKKTDFMWEHLAILKLWAYYQENNPYSDIPREVLLFMLSRSPSLKHLHIKDCQTFDDDLLRQVFLSHQFKTVEYLSFVDCSSISKVGIDLFMKESNLLKLLSCVECRSVSNDDVVDWREKAKTNNWDFQVDFCAAK